MIVKKQISLSVKMEIATESVAKSPCGVHGK